MGSGIRRRARCLLGRNNLPRQHPRCHPLHRVGRQLPGRDDAGGREAGQAIRFETILIDQEHLTISVATSQEDRAAPWNSRARLIGWSCSSPHEATAGIASVFPAASRSESRTRQEPRANEESLHANRHHDAARSNQHVHEEEVRQASRGLHRPALEVPTDFLRRNTCARRLDRGADGRRLSG